LALLLGFANNPEKQIKILGSNPITIKYQVDGNYPPFSYVHDNDLVGFDFYLTNLIFPSNLYILDYSTDTWDKVYQRITSGEIDIAGIIAVNEQRKEEVLFTKTLFRSFVSVFSRNDLDISDISELKDTRIGVGKGYYTEAILRDELELDYIAYEDINQALLDLKEGRIDVLFENDQLVKNILIKQNLVGTIIEQITDLYPRDHAYAVSKSKPELVTYMNERITELQKSGVFEEIYMNYFYEHSDTYLSQRSRSTVLWALAIFFGSIVLFWSLQQIIRRLRKRLRQKVSELETKNLELKDRYAEIRSLAYFNPVTNLPNRNQLRHDLTLLSHTADTKAVLIMVDLEKFNEINDAFGHHIGDRVLNAMAERFRSIVPPEGKLYNLTSQQFVFVGQPIEREIFKVKANEILTAIRQPINVEDTSIYLSASMGIVFYPEHGDSFDKLISCVDIAMLETKRNRKGEYTIYDDRLGQQFQDHLDLLKNMRVALEHNAFELHYQPIVKMDDLTPVGFEALIRYKHPSEGLKYPNYFIEILEESRLIIPVGYWIMETACRFITQYNEKYKVNLSVSVNISSIQLLHEDFIENVHEILSKSSSSTKNIVFEITESVTLENVELAIERLQALRTMGIQIAIDDFGTGYSSLSYIKDLPLDIIKIDKAFVQSINESEKNHSVAQSIVSIGHALGLILIAEGVETPEQLQVLSSLGCDRIQGYLISKPKPEADLHLHTK
jgi:diguanylate cyclase (GGDEF)-like protein